MSMADNYTVIDVREPAEYATGHVKGAMNIPPDKLLNGTIELNNIPKKSKIIVYCRSGSRSNVAMHILKQHGYLYVTNGINKQNVEALYGL